MADRTPPAPVPPPSSQSSLAPDLPTLDDSPSSLLHVDGQGTEARPTTEQAPESAAPESQAPGSAEPQIADPDPDYEGRRRPDSGLYVDCSDSEASPSNPAARVSPPRLAAAGQVELTEPVALPPPTQGPSMEELRLSAEGEKPPRSGKVPQARQTEGLLTALGRSNLDEALLLSETLAAMPEWGDAEGGDVTVDLHFRGRDLLAVRGASTATFVRVVLLDRDRPSGAEIEVGRTETVRSLSPNFKTVLQVKYRATDAHLSLRFDVCSPDSVGYEVVGTEVLHLSQLHREVRSSAATVDLELRQHAEVVGDVTASMASSRAPSVAGSARGDAEASAPGAGAASSQVVLRRSGNVNEDLGHLSLVPELVSADSRFCCLLFGAAGLRVDNVSFPPDPYVQILRQLADGTACLVYRTKRSHYTRDAVWKSAPIPMQRLCNGDPEAKLVFEVWDNEEFADDRLIGAAEMTANELISASSSGASPLDVPLQPPAKGDRRAARKSSLLGLTGTPAKPGCVRVHAVSLMRDDALAAREADCFDTHAITADRRANAMPAFVPLAGRMDRHRLKRQRGLNTVDTNCGHRVAALCSCLVDACCKFRLTRLFWHYEPFHQAHHTIGARLGSSTAAYFEISIQVLLLNVFLMVLWLPLVVVPQILSSDCARDLQHDFDYMFNTVTNQALNGTWAGEPSLFFFGGYKPLYYIDSDRNSGTAWPMDACYVTCIFATFGLSLIHLVNQIGAKADSSERVQRAATKSKLQGDHRIVDTVLSGFDSQITSRGGTEREKQRVVTELNEALEAAQRSDRAKLVLSQSARTRRTLRRVAGGTASALLLAGGIAGITAALHPDTKPSLENDIHTLAPEAIVTLISTLLPPIVKIIVRFEKWSPEATLYHTMGRSFVIKMSSLLVVWFNLELGVAQELDSPEACHETSAGLVFFRLIVTDLLLTLAIALILRPLLWKIPKFKSKPLSLLPTGKKAIFDLPSEMMKLVYRQALLWVGSMFMPLMFFWGTINCVIIYFALYLSLRYFHRPPLKPFGAARAVEFFLAVLFCALLVCVVPYGLFLNDTANNKCGPLRPPVCAPINTTCGADVVEPACTAQRLNLDGFAESFFPTDVVATTVVINGTTVTSAATGFAQCDNATSYGRCFISVLLDLVFSRGVLVAAVLCLALFTHFTHRRLRRATRQLRATTRQLQEEHHDKVMLIRTAGIAYD